MGVVCVACDVTELKAEYLLRLTRLLCEDPWPMNLKILQLLFWSPTLVANLAFAQPPTGFKVVVHSSHPTTSLEKIEISELFLKQTSHLPNRTICLTVNVRGLRGLLSKILSAVQSAAELLL